MFKILSKNEKNEYDVLDTSDGVIESVSADDIFNYINLGIDFDGVTVSDSEIVIEYDKTSWHCIHKGLKFRLYPNKEQQEYFQKCFGCCRFIWNHMLADKIAYYKEYGESTNFYPSYYKKDFPFLNEVDSYALAQEYMHLSTAFKNFFQRPEVGYPNFKSKKDNHKSYSTTNQRNCIRIEGSHIRLPKIGFVKFKQSQPVLGDIKTVTVSQVPSCKYFISFGVVVWQKRLPISDKEVGIDLGIKELVITSDKEHFEK